MDGLGCWIWWRCWFSGVGALKVSLKGLLGELLDAEASEVGLSRLVSW